MTKKQMEKMLVMSMSCTFAYSTGVLTRRIIGLVLNKHTSSGYVRKGDTAAVWIVGCTLLAWSTYKLIGVKDDLYKIIDNKYNQDEEQ